MPRTLIVTNDFPPRRGGIESFVRALADRLGDVVVYTASMPGDAETDAALGYPVIRDRSGTLLPTKRVRDAVVATFTEHGCDRVLIGSSVPLGLLAPALRAAGATRIVAVTHGHEVWWSRLPGTRQALRRVGDAVDVLTDISDWTRAQIGRALSAQGRAKQTRLAPGVDTEAFRPGAGGAEVRAQLGFEPTTPVVVCGARLVKRKGQDMLVEAWPAVLAAVPDARLVIVGDGPHRATLEDLVVRRGVADAVTFAGSVPWDRMPGWMDAANVFAMPSRSRLLGLEPEGLGIVFLEAAACEKPVIVGRSGGAPEATLDGQSGYVVDPSDPGEIAARVVELLQDPERAAAMGERGRAWVHAGWQWDQVGATARRLLGL
ncbi:glycosyl transferase group 1 [Xylanimonas cellulosilytica DSM 15894]|uniref:D-inositol 3-phosphate glycosyltransferase n=1 Tax=Xylanimonas cellulosilytica (strain DSM 15894 / JCM 12276 / CECT 5975 / KCTC 9989 / LMG 20990 / NBRC 107835 / XIL07) TaxID=446471 RepID=D1BWD1_XYLCX|nr:glycosyltransferase family 4 protein [Xylanimonas cellulosilytica]ACZ31476.1 glycosyl transferase group 1 [Xylanimonas cellulosilytica DSM 15894]